MKRLSVAVVGLNFGRTFIREHLLEGPALKYVELSAVCDSDVARCEQVALEYGVRPYFSLDAVLADSAIAVIILLTGPSNRAELLSKVIQSGKHCITTKPFELSSRRAAAVFNEAKALKRMIHLNSPSVRDSRDFQLIDQWRSQYNLGQPVGGHHESWYKCVEVADGSWYDDATVCPVAPALRLGIYGIHDLIRVLGEPEEIQVMQSRLFTGRPTPDWARLGIKFKGGAIGDSLTGFVTSPERHESSLILYFERGTIYRNPPMLPGSAVRARNLETTYLCLCMGDDSDGMPVESIRLPNSDLSIGYKWERFHNAVVTGDHTALEPMENEIIHGIRVLECLAEAAETGCTVKLKPAGPSRI